MQFAFNFTLEKMIFLKYHKSLVFLLIFWEKENEILYEGVYFWFSFGITLFILLKHIITINCCFEREKKTINCC